MVNPVILNHGVIASPPHLDAKSLTVRTTNGVSLNTLVGGPIVREYASPPGFLNAVARHSIPRGTPRKPDAPAEGRFHADIFDAASVNDAVRNALLARGIYPEEENAVRAETVPLDKISNNKAPEAKTPGIMRGNALVHVGIFRAIQHEVTDFTIFTT